MKLRGYMIALLMVCASAPLATAQSNLEAATSETYQPRLGDIMNAIQSRHIKLWFAGKALNWELAAYEARQLKAGLVQAAVMYEGIPVSNVTTMAASVQVLADAIAAKEVRRFAKVAGELTDGCNACHRSLERGFIVIRIPAEQPFSDQVFTPQAKR
jgi:hypothetical protein